MNLWGEWGNTTFSYISQIIVWQLGFEILWSFTSKVSNKIPSFHVSWLQDFWLAQTSFQPRRWIHTFHSPRGHAEADLGRGDAEHGGFVTQEDPALSKSRRTSGAQRFHELSSSSWGPQDGLCHGKSHLEMDDEQGYPYFRTPPWFVMFSLKPSDVFGRLTTFTHPDVGKTRGVFLPWPKVRKNFSARWVVTARILEIDPWQHNCQPARS